MSELSKQPNPSSEYDDYSWYPALFWMVRRIPKPKNCYTPSQAHDSIARLATDPPTLNHPIQRPASDNLAENAVFDFLEDCYDPSHDIEPSRTFVNPSREDTKLLPSCSRAERNMARTFNAMQETDTATVEQSSIVGWTIVVDDQSQPIAVKKYIGGVESSLSLAPLSIDGHRYPAGSLLDISLKKNPKTSIKDARTVTPYSNIESIHFLRLSAFCHEPEERSAIFKAVTFPDITDDQPYTPGELLSLDEIGNLAKSKIPTSKRIGYQAPHRALAGDNWTGLLKKHILRRLV